MVGWRVLFIFILLGFFTTILITTVPLYAQEISNNHIRKLKDEIEQAKENYSKTDAHIIAQRSKVSEYEVTQKTLTAKLTEYENSLGTSWEAIMNINQTRSGLETNTIRLENSKETLKELQKEKARWLKEREKLEAQLESDNLLYIEQNQPDLSKYTKLVGVRLSLNCILMIKEGIESDCPTYEELEQVDTSNKKISGEFKFIDGYYQREKSQYKNEWAWYQHDEQVRVIVDPSVEHMDRIKMIVIEHNFDTYFEYPDFKVINNTITQHRDRAIENNCRDAQIAADDWMTLLPDTLHYLRTQCTETNFDNTVTIVREDTPWDPTTSAGWQYREWVSAMKILCLGLCW